MVVALFQTAFVGLRKTRTEENTRANRAQVSNDLSTKLLVGEVDGIRGEFAGGRVCAPLLQSLPSDRQLRALWERAASCRWGLLRGLLRGLLPLGGIWSRARNKTENVKKKKPPEGFEPKTSHIGTLSVTH